MHASSDDDEYGPCMRQLTTKQQRFVIAYLEQPTQNGSAAARAAGYQSKGAGIRVEAMRQLRNERVLAALREEVDKRFRSDTVIARGVLLEIALDPQHPAVARLKAATALLDRGGFHSMSEQRITVDHRDLTGDAMIERIKALAVELGVDATKLLGYNGHATAEAPAITIEAEALTEAEAVASAPPPPRVTRYVARAMVSEYQRVGWQAPHDPEQDRDLVEVTWMHEREPVEPDTRPMTAG
jgi:phage terminase small subunit